MKYLILLTAFLVVCSNTYSQTRYDWIGLYSYPYDKVNQFAEGLDIKKSKRSGKDFEWTYESTGRQRYFVIKGYAVNKGSYVDFYFEEVSDGAYYPEDKIIKAKPFFKMMYSKSEVLTKWIQPDAQKKYHKYFVPD